MIHDTTLAVEWQAADGTSLPPDVRVVDDGLERFNREAANLTTSTKFATLARDATGNVVGGAIARWWGESCELMQLWVADAHRQRGVGRRLVETTEAYARSRGCTLFYLETFTFQAPAFYEKLGYHVACELPGFPGGVSKLILRKQLSPPIT